MDPGQHSQPASTNHGNDDEMHIEVHSASELNVDQTEVEMIGLNSVTGPSLDTVNAQSTPMNTSTSTSPDNEYYVDASSQTVSSSPTAALRTGTRRSRVEEDNDDDRDRRHPSQRLGSPSQPLDTAASASPLSPPQATATPLLSGGSQASPSISGRLPTSLHPRFNPFHFFRHMLPPSHLRNLNPASSSFAVQSHNPSSQQNNAAAGPSSTVASAPNNVPPSSSTSTNVDDAQHQTPRPNPRHQYLAGFSITIDMNGGLTTSGTPLPNPQVVTNADTISTSDPTSPPPSGQALRENPVPTDEQEITTQALPQPQPQPQTQPQTQAADGAQHSPLPSDGASAFAEFLTRIGLLAALSFRDSGIFERDVDDPERAKKLLDGLEDVPVGLIQRLERVGKVNGAGESRAGETSENNIEGLGDGGCAICWERLLLEASDSEQGSEREERKNDVTEQSSSEEDMDTSPIESEFHSLASTSQKNVPPESTDTGHQYQRIVSLPCAHVFHAQCLVPWFSKPKQTTCPICRFNIDPENLTYTSRAQRRAAARAQTRTQEQQREGDNPSQGVGEGDVGAEAGPNVDGINVPLMFGGASPIVIPLTGGLNVNNTTQTPVLPAGVEPQQSQPPTGDRVEPSRSDPNPSTNENRPPGNDIVTIGFDMYIGRGPPPFPFRGPNVIQIPIPGGPGAPATNNTTNATSPLPNPAVNAPPGTPIDGSSATNATNLAEGANENTTNTNDNGVGGARGPGTTFAIPMPMSAGFGRAIGDMLSRIFSATGGNPPQDGPTQPQEPVTVGPERPPVLLPGSLPTPANGNVGLGFGTGGQGPHPILPPFFIPFGPRGVAEANIPPRAPGGQGVSGALPPQSGAPHPVGFEGVPLFDIFGGMFGPPLQGQVGAQREADRQRPGSETHQQPVQPQPQGNDNSQPPAGVGFIWPSDSLPPRPASAPVPRQQAPRKKWVLPPAPGLTLRQRVEKKEQEAGLRCSDISCGVGPSDEDPWVNISQECMKQVRIYTSPANEIVGTVDSGVGLDQLTTDKGEISADGGTGKQLRSSVCPHTFHSSCLVTSERVSRGTQVSLVGLQGKEAVEVSCPICRGAGTVNKEDWDAGVEALN